MSKRRYACPPRLSIDHVRKRDWLANARRTRYRRSVRILLVLLMGAALVPPATADATVASGLRGVVMRGPVKPICEDGNSCDRPAAGLLLVFKHDGRTAARTTTRADGTYSVRLRAGRYGVSPVPAPRIGTGLTPRWVRVPTGRVARIDFHLDTGLQ